MSEAVRLSYLPPRFLQVLSDDQNIEVLHDGMEH
jgi:hypothetical protein